jgi:RNA polymerase sigma-70 factor (ECF subfamily)
VTSPKPPGDSTRPVEDVARLESAFREHASRVFAYARRHTTADAADDVVSETFLVAWRRRAELPEEPLPWLLVVARNLVANHRRSGARADRLWLAAVREQWHLHAGAPADEAVVERERYLEALQSCTRPEREALLLVAWDGLTVTQAAAVAGCSPRAFTVRLSRARARMRARIDADATPPAASRSTAPAVAAPEPGLRTPETPRLSIAQELS